VRAVLRAVGATSAAGVGPASEPTRQFQQSVSLALLAQAPQALEDARRGFMAALPDPVIRRADGLVIWDMNAYRFIDEANAPPDTVHPALWQQARINNLHGLFRVTDRIYPVRGYDVDPDHRVHGWCGRGAATRPHRLRSGRVPLGGASRLAAGVRRSRQSRGARAGGRRVRAARLPG
jgi:alkyl sulfatase BDS1-like metallo-beta-lactamase superfamily hydrolase